MVSEKHLQYLSEIIDEVNVTGIAGAIVECGVWKGGCSMWMTACQKRHSMNRQIFLYDTFEGMTFPSSDKDADEAKAIYTQINANTYRRGYDGWHTENKWAYAPLDMVKENIDMVGYDESQISFVKGDVLVTLNETIPKEISILRLDTDWYDSTKKELDILFPLVSAGGYIIVDDYYAWKGSRVATDEFLVVNGAAVTRVNTDTGGIFVLRKK